MIVSSSASSLAAYHLRKTERTGCFLSSSSARCGHLARFGLIHRSTSHRLTQSRRSFSRPAMAPLARDPRPDGPPRPALSDGLSPDRCVTSSPRHRHKTTHREPTLIVRDISQQSLFGRSSRSPSCQRFISSSTSSCPSTASGFASACNARPVSLPSCCSARFEPSATRPVQQSAREPRAQRLPGLRLADPCLL